MHQATEDDALQTVSIVVVGDGAVGKTTLIMAMTSQSFPDGYVPTVMDSQNLRTERKDDGKPFNIVLNDTGGGQEYGLLRPRLYHNANVVVICFSIINAESCQHVLDLWIPEKQEHAPKATVILIATKVDLRDDADTIEKFKSRGETMITEAEGQEIAKRIDACCYIETSARMQLGVDELLQTALSVGDPSTAGAARKPGTGGEKEKSCCTM